MLETDFGEIFHFSGGQGGRHNADFVAWWVMGKGDKSRNGQTGRSRAVRQGKKQVAGLGWLFGSRWQGGAKNRARRANGTALGEGKGRTRLPSLLQYLGFVPNAPSVTVAPFAPRDVQREEEVSFLFFLLDEGLVQRGGVCYKCTRCYNCTICTKCAIKPLFL